jgi:hypothetical protein
MDVVIIVSPLKVKIVYNFKIVHNFEHSLYCCISYAFYFVLVLRVSISNSGQFPQKDIKGNITVKIKHLL